MGPRIDSNLGQSPYENLPNFGSLSHYVEPCALSGNAMIHKHKQGTERGPMFGDVLCHQIQTTVKQQV